MAKWNRRTLLAACEEFLQREDVRLVLRPVKEPETAGFVADVAEDGSLHNVVVTIDTAQGGLIECVLHEMLHIVLDDSVAMKFNKSLEESIVKSLERELFTKAIKHGSLRRWRRLIDAKLLETG